MVRIFNDINLRNVRGDMFGGVTAAIVALPMALAFGVASGAGAEAGLYAAILIGLFASLFGGSPTLMSEPTGPMTVVFTAVIAKLIASDPVNGMAMAFTVVVMAGVFQIAFGLMRLGKFVTMMPYSVVSGFMSGIGIILIILQIGPLLGHSAPGGGVMGVINGIPDLIANLKVHEAILAAGTIAILFLVPGKLKRYVPPQLLALVVITLISIWFLSDSDIRRVGEIPSGLPEFRMPVFSAEQWQIMLIDAIVLGVLGCIDALLTSVIADSLTRKEHNSDKELIGQGIGNMVSGLFGGLPGAGATMGTVVGIQAGASSALAGLIRAGLLIVIVFWASSLTALIPMALLAGIALKVGIDIIDWGYLRRAHRISMKGAIVTYSVIALTVFVDLIVAVGLGLFVANVMTITRLSKLQADDVKTLCNPDNPYNPEIELSDTEHRLMQQAKGQILLFYMRGKMIFGTSRNISRQNSKVKNRKVLVVDMTDVSYLGVSAALALEESVLDMAKAGRSVYISGAGEQSMERLRNLGVVDQLPPESFVDNRERALERALYSIESSSA